MKKVSYLLITAIMLLMYSGCSNAQQGAVIGGAAGAGAGYVIGGNMDD